MIDSGLFELWNHSYYHKNFQEIKDFKITNDLIIKNQKTVKRELGITMHAFGAPYNKCSQLMQESLEANSEIKIWLYGNTSSGVSYVLDSRIDVEFWIDDICHTFDFEKFLKAYNQNTSSNNYWIIELHPALLIGGGGGRGLCKII